LTNHDEIQARRKPLPNEQQSQREFAVDVVKRLRAAGHEALWAGGCVRDQLLGLTPKDYDVATSARPDAVRELFGHRRTLAIGAAFGVISLRGGRLSPIEIATFRTDGEYRDGRRPVSVAFSDAEHDAQRRDFTINGLFFDPLAERVVDYVGGVADIERRIVRAIGDPVQRFREDKLRMLRAVRFAAAFDFAIDPSTLAAVQAMAGEVLSVSGERIGAELTRILAGAGRARGAHLLAEAGLVQPLLPELVDAVGDERWQAALVRLDRLDEPTLPAALAALVYGMMTPEEVRTAGRRLRLSNKVIDRTAWIVEHLPQAAVAAELAWPRLQRLLAHDGSAELRAVAEAMLPAGDPGVARWRAQLARAEDQWNPAPLVTGDDLAAHGIKPGRQYATLLEHLRDEQLEGRLHSAEEALDEATRWLRRGGPS
jgi:tRNA nucleotidyltransferase/poly(A) polymerase